MSGAWLRLRGFRIVEASGFDPRAFGWPEVQGFGSFAFEALNMSFLRAWD